jgi:hypothetical protein
MVRIVAPSIAAVPQEYGYKKFRSTTEARWAVFFDTLGIGWESEPKTYDTVSSGWYIPDFWLPGPFVFWEVKGLPGEGHAKAQGLADATGYGVVVAVGEPDVPPRHYQWQSTIFVPKRWQPWPTEMACAMAECCGCNALGLGVFDVRTGKGGLFVGARFHDCAFAENSPPDIDVSTPRLVNAYATARRYEFWTPPSKTWTPNGNGSTGNSAPSGNGSIHTPDTPTPTPKPMSSSERSNDTKRPAMHQCRGIRRYAGKAKR